MKEQTKRKPRRDSFGKVQVDSTAQEKNITFPTDAKLRKRVIDKCNKIAKKEKIVQRQTYKRVSKKLLRDSYFGHHPKRRKSADSARRKLKTIGGRLIRELERNLPENRRLFYSKELTLYKKVLEQTRNSKDKIYPKDSFGTVYTNLIRPVLRRAKPEGLLWSG